LNASTPRIRGLSSTKEAGLDKLYEVDAELTVLYNKIHLSTPSKARAYLFTERSLSLHLCFVLKNKVKERVACTYLERP
jgi:hypothetical protein